MNEKRIEAIIASPLVVQLFVEGAGQWGEIFRETGHWWLELYQRPDGHPWRLDLEEARKVMNLALEELHRRLGNP
jgi:hypothetical protein